MDKKFFMFEQSEFEKFPILSAGCGALSGKSFCVLFLFAEKVQL